MILQEVIWMERYDCETQFTRTEFSPENWDWLREQQQLGCEWFRLARKTIETELAREAPNLRPQLFQDNPLIKDRIFGRD